MSSTDRLNRIARRQLEHAAPAVRRRAERADIMREAKALCDSLEMEDVDVFAVLEVASFLAGDD